MNHTTNYQLSQWEASDRIQRADFNADNAKIDAAIKAEADARAMGDAALQTAVAGKADASALSVLAQTVAHKGNCQIVTGSYVGTGKSGVNNPNTLTFPKKPLVVFLCNPGWGSAVAVYGTLSSGVPHNTGTTMFQLTWTDNSLSWYCTDPAADYDSQLNKADKTYHYFALVEA